MTTVGGGGRPLNCWIHFVSFLLTFSTKSFFLLLFYKLQFVRIIFLGRLPYTTSQLALRCAPIKIRKARARETKREKER